MRVVRVGVGRRPVRRRRQADFRRVIVMRRERFPRPRVGLVNIPLDGR